MRHSFPALRRAAVVIVAVLSVVGAAALAWILGTPERLGWLSNAQLAGLVALFFLPAAALGAWELDRRATPRKSSESDRPEGGGVHVHEPGGDRREAHRHRIRAEDRINR